jgi:hypothetical protein
MIASAGCAKKKMLLRADPVILCKITRKFLTIGDLWTANRFYRMAMAM